MPRPNPASRAADRPDFARARGLLPRPRHAVAQPGRFSMTADTTAAVQGFDAEDELRLIRALGRLGVAVDRVASAAIVLSRCAEVPTLGAAPGAYALTVTTAHVSIDAVDGAGAFHALQTLQQLLPDSRYRTSCADPMPWWVPASTVVDAPALQWRGMLIDVARHFLPKADLLRLIDQLAGHRYNTVQLHLTDDQGWRIESERHPRLHEVGSVRPESQRSHFSDPAIFDGTPHGGYYTRADLVEIVRFAADRYVTVVPEVDLPGHTAALLAAYPEHGLPRDAPRVVAREWGVLPSLISPLPVTRAFLRDVLDEVLELFPGPYVHLGGDEARLDAWDDDEEVLAYCRDRGLDDARALHADLMRDLGAWLSERGRTLVTWDDSYATDPHAAPAGVIVAWRGEAVARRAARDGHPVVLAPYFPAYFDCYQSESPLEPLASGGPVTLADVGRFDPQPADWSSAEQANVLGAQGQLWTEFIADPRHLEYMAFPRAAVLADVMWQGRPVDGADLDDRLARHLTRLDAAGVNYRPPAGPRPHQAGGTGLRRHRRDPDLHDVVRRLAVAAVSGDVAEPERPQVDG